jgi:GNAT superfamily N-acetyltransferase
VTAGTLVAARSQAVRPLREADLPLLARLHEQVSRAERDESGTTGLPAYGYFDDGTLLAVACLGAWHQMPTIRVLTLPQARGQGLAGMVVAAAAREGLSHRAVVQYRAWRANTTSISVAARSGFTRYCEGLVIELDA